MSVLLAVGFTSTLMHYYFDGFIWKLRHRQNREGLALTTGRDNAPFGNQQPERTLTPRQALGRQLLYFGVPMLVLSIGAVSQWSQSSHGYIHDMYAAYQASQRGDAEQALRDAELAFTAMERDLPIARRLAALDATAAREADLAFLVYNHSYYANIVLPALTGQPERRDRHRLGVAEAIELLGRALQMSGPIGHPGRENLTREDARRTLASWQRLAA
jgi:hypothetical protein